MQKSIMLCAVIFLNHVYKYIFERVLVLSSSMFHFCSKMANFLILNYCGGHFVTIVKIKDK